MSLKAIESLTKKLHEMEQERQFEKLHIQTLQGKLMHYLPQYCIYTACVTYVVLSQYEVLPIRSNMVHWKKKQFPEA